MAKSVLYMSISLDGFITGPHDGPGNGLGDGHRLHGGFAGRAATGCTAGSPAAPTGRSTG